MSSLMDAHGPLVAGTPVGALTQSPDTFDDRWYMSQRKEIRQLRGRRFSNSEATALINFLVDRGVIAHDDFDVYLKIIGYNWNPSFVLDGLPAPPRAADMIVKAKPFTWSNRQADPVNRDAIGTTYNPNANDKSEIGAIYPDETLEPRFEKLLMYPRSESGTATADSSDAEGRVAYWVRVA